MTIDALTSTIKNIIGPDYIIWFDSDSSAYKLRNTRIGTITSNATEAGALFNTAIDDLTTNGGWIHFHGILNIITTIIPKSKIKITGDGPMVSVLKLANSQDKEVMKSLNFDSLTGTNGTGGPEEVTLADFSIDGNKTNQSTATNCYGIRKFGHNWILENVYVYNCKNTGMYAEFGDSGCEGPFLCLEDYWSNIQSMHNDGNGITFRGPHDSVFHNVKCFLNGIDGMVVEYSVGNYNGGAPYISQSHNYSNGEATGKTSVNLRLSGPMYAFLDDVTAEFQGGVGGTGILVENSCRLFGNGIVVYLNDIGIKTTSSGVIQINGLNIDSAYTVGVEIGTGSLDNRILGGFIGNVTGNGAGTGTGLILGGVGSLNIISGLLLYDCKTAMLNITSLGINNTIHCNIHQNATNPTAVSGTTLADWWWAANDVKIQCSADGATQFKHDNRGTATIVSGTTSIAVNHGLGITPTLQMIRATPSNNPTNDPGHFWLSNPTSTQFTINVRSNPGTSGASFNWEIRASI